MIKNINKGLLSVAVLAIAGLSSCEDDTTYEIYQTPSDVTLKAVTPELTFKGNATQYQLLEFTSPVYPTVTKTGDWTLFKLNEFTPNYDYQYLILPKASLDEQTYTVTVKAGDATETITIHQTPADPGFMGLGWNLGNQMEASNNGVADETCWGNPACTQATMDGVKAAGFETVRIPVTWLGHIGAAPDYTIDAAWLNRVAEIVGYAQNAGLKAVINIHHDDDITEDGESTTNAWINIKKAAEDSAANAQMTEEIKAVWTQIANKFKDVPTDQLMFEAFNEVQDGKWGNGANTSDGGAQYAVLNAWNQAVVDAIRATGGNNYSRWIGVPAYAASASFVDYFVMPTDPTDHVACSVHSYDPYNFCITTEVNTWGTAEEYASIDNFMFILTDMFINQGIQVYIGEFGCAKRADASQEQYRLAWLKNFTRMARTYGISCFLWDNAFNDGGKESHAYLDHGTGKPIDATAEAAIQAVINGYNNVK